MLKKIYRRILALGVIGLCFGMNLNAQNAVKMVESDGTETFFMLSTTPTVKLNENTLTVTTSQTEITCEVGGGVSFELCDYEPGAVGEIEESAPAYKLTGDTLETYNLKPGETIMIFDLAGRTVKNRQTDNAGYCNIYIGDLPSGVYVVNSNSNKFKFYKK